MTGGRVRRMKPYIENETFLLTYGDGVSNVNLEELVAFHKNHGKLVTVTAVRPGAFGNCNSTTSSDILSGKAPAWTRLDQRGYFVIEPGFFDLIAGDSTILEREPLEQAARMGELMAFKQGFWQCMDTKRDRDTLRKCGGGKCFVETVTNHVCWSLVEPVLSVTTCWLQLIRIGGNQCVAGILPVHNVC